MSLNVALLLKLREVETRYGYQADEWPPKKLTEVQKLAFRYVDRPTQVDIEQKMDIAYYYQRGFFETTIANKMHRSRRWVVVRRPESIEYILPAEDRRELQKLIDQGHSVSKISHLMQRNADWVREMEERL